ncbi:MAG: hypothetical protein JO273_19710 [Methylobacteriaceae bacterium]|nr:hypothetical protein [Methylobacteriaceae bacterium]
MATRTRITLGATLFAAALGWVVSGSVQAQSIMKTCGDEWGAAKKAGTVQTGTTWPKFLSECRARHANDAAAPSTSAPAATAATPPAPAAPASPPAAPASPPAATAATAPPAAPAPTAATPAAPAPTAAAPAAPAAPTATATPTGKPATGGREAMLARERQCGARWKEIKGTASLPTGITTWPKYWSWCNTQLKNGQSI